MKPAALLMRIEALEKRIEVLEAKHMALVGSVKQLLKAVENIGEHVYRTEADHG